MNKNGILCENKKIKRIQIFKKKLRKNISRRLGFKFLSCQFHEINRNFFIVVY